MKGHAEELGEWGDQLELRWPEADILVPVKQMHCLHHVVFRLTVRSRLHAETICANHLMEFHRRISCLCGTVNWCFWRMLLLLNSFFNRRGDGRSQLSKQLVKKAALLNSQLAISFAYSTAVVCGRPLMLAARPLLRGPPSTVSSPSQFVSYEVPGWSCCFKVPESFANFT